MSAHGGPNIVEDGLVLALDAANTKSSLRKKQSSNILVDPNTWSPGTGGSSGYSANGSSSEQNRLYVNDDPWGRRSVTWRTTPDATSGADGGWNSSYYSIDRSFTYRWSVWVRRYTSGTGGTFYMGLNPAPIRNDNGASQGNPYFTYPSIASLTQNQWYLVVGHCFYEGYSGGRHPESGWYENGNKISDKSYGNVGAQDVRWASGTTSAMHRAYHYYTTNTASGIEFAFPRIDKLDGSEPSIKELINVGESGWKGLSVNKKKANFYNGITFNNSNLGNLVFDGVDDSVSTTSPSTLYTGDITAEVWIKINANSNDWVRIVGAGGNSTNRTFGLWYSTARRLLWQRYGGNDPSIYPSNILNLNQWYHIAATTSGNSHVLYLNGNSIGTNTAAGPWAGSSETVTIGFAGFHTYTNSSISMVRLYNRGLTSTEILQHYNATKGRFGL